MSNGKTMHPEFRASKPRLIVIKPDGTAVTLGDCPILESLGPVKRERVSHIWPVNPWKRAAFRTLRFIFGDRGIVASWTRRWLGPWRATILGSNESITYPTRQQCVEWEERTIEQN